jgi:hypothetical protein
MQVRLYRHAGHLGRFVALDVRVNGKKVASLKSKETLILQLSSDGVTMQVAMGNSSSPALHLPPWNGGVELECGTHLWVLFDVLSLAYVPPLNERVFFLREIARA